MKSSYSASCPIQRFDPSAAAMATCAGPGAGCCARGADASARAASAVPVNRRDMGSLLTASTIRHGGRAVKPLSGAHGREGRAERTEQALHQIDLIAQQIEQRLALDAQ